MLSRIACHPERRSDVSPLHRTSWNVGWSILVPHILAAALQQAEVGKVHWYFLYLTVICNLSFQINWRSMPWLHIPMLKSNVTLQDSGLWSIRIDTSLVESTTPSRFMVAFPGSCCGTPPRIRRGLAKQLWFQVLTPYVDWPKSVSDAPQASSWCTCMLLLLSLHPKYEHIYSLYQLNKQSSIWSSDLVI